MRRNPLGRMSFASIDLEPKLTSQSLFINGSYHVDTYVRPIRKIRTNEVSDINIESEVATEVLILGE